MIGPLQTAPGGPLALREATAGGGRNTVVRRGLMETQLGFPIELAADHALPVIFAPGTRSTHLFVVGGIFARVGVQSP